MPYFDLSASQHNPDSPGSSVFDLPTQPHRAGENRSRQLTPTQTHRGHDELDTSFVVVSGGTGCNSIVAAFGNACYVLPVSDDGGSSSEIIRVLGGPSIGDIRSRLVRLIPPAPPSSPLDRIRNLLAYRLPTKCTEREARDEWRDIVEGRSPLWTGIPNDRKEMIRGLLVYFESEVLKRAHKNFSFLNGSIGNYFLSAATEFFRSLPSAIFLFSSITNSQANILPVIVTNHTVTIAAELEDGTKLVGQCEISHPVRSSVADLSISVEPTRDALDGNVGRPANVLFESTGKDDYEPLESRISRLFYINAYGNEIHPSPNPDYLHNLGQKDVLIYSCGSLWTSVVPCLALRGVASAIARSRSLRAKVLLLNAQNDRETDGYKAVDYISTISRTLNASYQPQSQTYGGLGRVTTTYPVSAFVTHVVYLKNTLVEVDVGKVVAMGVKCVEVTGPSDERTGLPKFDAECVRKAIQGILSDEARLNDRP
ncbi:UPF0052-domain-containing protein [Cristinia sonorae]|uniref:UPF0052-domain-containing protein n=1 Tax=Cristinia sonorae TaxID=1940300 RepID=A0A8K0UPZ5_9AGAR|nr:UPF0052-domain-containing protein [Cristinia sonorae]